MASDRPTVDEIQRAIREAIADRAERRHGSRPVVSAEQTLEALGIDSLDLHELVDRLEAILQLDPFAHGYSINDARTVDDLYRAYRAAAADGAFADPPADEALLASQRRAAARRGRTT